MNYKRRLRHHCPTLLAFGLVLAVLALAHLFVGGGWRTAWLLLDVPSMEPSFADLRTITHSLDAVRNGNNPYVQTDFDPWHRLYNYPRAWFWFASAGVGSQHTNVIGVLMVAVFMASFVLLFDCRSKTTALIAFAMALSPPVLFAIERANSDILIFSILTIGFMSSSKLPPNTATTVRSALIVLLTVLKIYPFVVSAALVRNRGSLVVPAAVGAVALAALYFSLMPGDLALVLANTPQSANLSYGSLPLIERVGPYVDLFDMQTIRRIALVLALIAAAGVAILSFYRASHLRIFLPPLVPGRMRDDIAVAFLAIFLFSFLLGANFNYRLIFLIGVVPAMLRGYDTSREWSLLALPLGILLFLWLSGYSPYVRSADEILDWCIFLAGTAMLALTIYPRLGVGSGEGSRSSAEQSSRPQAASGVSD